ncbi:hypothetical protein EDB92DRAFT_147644 [Lactarius akahatsu]|uniref:DUF6534 domain-containing protein n=1 Tax=Lactarius akahatsu TaxID=416441 RepID=A0AAD4LLY3_9AGAM|nr:hypothetical protein EDB92DRAFT_147644 [Lactarius akahatsu]
MPASSVADIQNTFGAAFVGLLISTTLFGLTIVQTWIYFWHYGKRDPKALKFFVAFITVMDTLHTILCAYAVYWYLVLNFGNVESLDSSMWALNIQVVVSIFISAPVRLYYTRRVYKVSQSIFVPILIAALVVLGSSFGFLFTAKEFILQRFANFHSLTWIPSVGLTVGALADLLIAAAMCWSLYRRKTGYARTDSTIISLMAYSINSGLLTSILAGAMPISFAISPSALIWLAFYWAMTKCYVNSLLAMLNCRDHVRDRSTDNPNGAFNLTSIRIEPPSETGGSKSSQPGVSVTIQRSTTSNFGLNKSDHGVEPTFEVPKQDASIIHSQSQGRTSESSA